MEAPTPDSMPRALVSRILPWIQPHPHAYCFRHLRPEAGSINRSTVMHELLPAEVGARAIRRCRPKQSRFFPA